MAARPGRRRAAARGAAPLPLPVLRRGPALRARARRAEVRRTAATRRRSRSAAAAIPELDLRAVERGRPAAGRDCRRLRFAHCPSCGAQIEFGADDARQECPFCASPIVTDTGVAAADQAAGAAAVPARRGRRRATAMNRWLGRLWFAPSDLKAVRPRRAGRCRASTSPTGPTTPRPAADYTGQRGTVYYESRPVTVVVNGRRQTAMQQVARIRWQPARGRVARDFDDVLVLGSTSLPKRFTDALAPWDLSALSRLRAEVPRRLPRRGLHRAGRGGLRRGARGS